jgi:VanZ family protein
MLLVSVLTFMPANRMASLGLTGFLLDLGHVPLFAGLSLLGIWAVSGPPLPRVAVVAIFCTLFSVVDEWGQRFAPGRVPSVGDFALDSAGILLGLTLGMLLVRGIGPAHRTRKGDSRS